MADGTTKSIDQVKVGDKIADAVPGQSGTKDNTVTAVIVTYTDHDFVDVTAVPVDGTNAAAEKPTASAAQAHAKAQAQAKAAATGKSTGPISKLSKKLMALAASVAILTAGATSATTTAAGTQHTQTPLSAAAWTENNAAPAPDSQTVAAQTTAVATRQAQAAGGGTLTTTFHHPFYDKTQTAFVQAEDLHVGDILQTTTGQARITNLHLYHANTTTYDLTIGELHTYYVVAGSTPVLVHNCDGSIEGHSAKCNCANGDAPRIPRNPAGRRGNAATQAQLNDVRDEFLAANPDWVHYAGGTDAVTGDALPEETIVGPNGERRFPDLSFRLPDGSPFYVNTVDTLSDGVTADPRELANAIDINMWGHGPVAMISKSRY
jgi:Pretoxin HINT domain